MTTAEHQPSSKPDNLFGVCAALGEEFGFNPLWLRIALATSLLWNPVAVLAGYAAAGVAVLLIRLLLPEHGSADQTPVQTASASSEPMAENDETELARAA